MLPYRNISVNVNSGKFTKLSYKNCRVICYDAGMGEFFENIGKLISRFVNWISGLFTGGSGDERSSVETAPPGGGAAPARGEELSGSKALRKPVSTEMDEASRKWVDIILSYGNAPGYDGISQTPEDLRGYLRDSARPQLDPTYGTAQNPVLEKSDDGRLVINIPKGSSSGFRSVEGDPSMTVFTILPPLGTLGYKGNDPAFRGNAYLIPKQMVENADIIFREVVLEGTPSNAETRIGAQYGLLASGTELVLDGFSSKVKITNVDALMDGMPQKGIVMNKQLLDLETLKHIAPLHRRFDAMTRWEGVNLVAEALKEPENDGLPHTREAIEAAEKANKRRQELYDIQITTPGYIEARMGKAGIGDYADSSKWEREYRRGIEEAVKSGRITESEKALIEDPKHGLANASSGSNKDQKRI
jgi:hypothetical protein